MPRKVCRECKRELDLSMFHKHSQNGHRPTCRECRSLEQSSGLRYSPLSYLKGISTKKTRKEIARDSRLRNKEKDAGKTARRRAAKKNASPLWANEKYISIFYQLAKEESVRLGIKIHVDHIIPLQSEFVCGLHNEFNLQLLPAIENIKKGNSLCQEK